MSRAGRVGGSGTLLGLVVLEGNLLDRLPNPPRRDPGAGPTGIVPRRRRTGFVVLAVGVMIQRAIKPENILLWLRRRHPVPAAVRTGP
jgi:hypothetical protein